MTRTLTMYGLGHCSTCQKAIRELEEAGWTVAFRDVKDAPLSGEEWQRMIADFGEKLVNRASLTWRGMSAGHVGREAVADEAPGYRRRR